MAAVLVPDLLRDRAGATPDRAALMLESGATMTYRQWDERSSAVARGLAGRGIGPGTTVALVFDNSAWHDYAVAYLGVHKAAAAAVPLSLAVAGPQLGRLLSHCHAALLMHQSGAVGPTGVGVRTRTVAELEDGQSNAPFQVPLAATDLAEIIYTSGTTGLPKGVACSHASIVVHDGPPEPEGPLAPLLHAFPVGTNAAQELLRISLRRGDRLPIAMHGFDPDRCAVVVERQRVARLQLVPAMAALLVSSGVGGRYDLSSVEVITLSSAPTAPALLTRLSETFPRARLVNAYALTESGTARTLNLDALATPDSVGCPVGRTELRIVDESDTPVPAGRTGEVWLRRPGAPPREYFADPAATAAAFVDGWLRTGDLGWLDADGALHLVDRSKDVIIRGGLNVSSVEVENVLYEHPAVAEAAVFGVPHDVLGQDVAAAVVLSAPVETRQLQAFVRARLAEHKTPHHISVVDALPRTASGKVRKAELAAAPRQDGTADGSSARAPFVAPSTREEAILAGIWKEVLGVTEIGVHDDFFEHGGHSLAAAQVAARVEERLGVSLPVSSVFEHPTIAEFAAAIGSP